MQYQITRTDDGYELAIYAFSQTLRRMVAIPAGEYETMDDIFCAYPELHTDPAK